MNNVDEPACARRPPQNACIHSCIHVSMHPCTHVCTVCMYVLEGFPCHVQNHKPHQPTDSVGKRLSIHLPVSRRTQPCCHRAATTCHLPPWSRAPSPLRSPRCAVCGVSPPRDNQRGSSRGLGMHMLLYCTVLYCVCGIVLVLVSCVLCIRTNDKVPQRRPQRCPQIRNVSCLSPVQGTLAPLAPWAPPPPSSSPPSIPALKKWQRIKSRLVFGGRSSRGWLDLSVSSVSSVSSDDAEISVRRLSVPLTRPERLR